MPTLYWPAEAWRALAATVPVTARSATAPTVRRAIVRRRRIWLFLRIRDDTFTLNMRGDSGVSVMPGQAAAVKGRKTRSGSIRRARTVWSAHGHQGRRTGALRARVLKRRR